MTRCSGCHGGGRYLDGPCVRCGRCGQVPERHARPRRRRSDPAIEDFCTEVLAWVVVVTAIVIVLAVAPPPWKAALAVVALLGIAASGLRS